MRVHVCVCMHSFYILYYSLIEGVGRRLKAFNVNMTKLILCDALRALVPFVQFKKRKKHSWRSVTFSTKSNTLPWVFFTFFKLHKRYQIAQWIPYIGCPFYHLTLWRKSARIQKSSTETLKTFYQHEIAEKTKII